MKMRSSPCRRRVGLVPPKPVDQCDAGASGTPNCCLRGRRARERSSSEKSIRQLSYKSYKLGIVLTRRLRACTLTYLDSKFSQGRGKSTVAQFNAGSLAPGASIRVSTWLTTVFNPQGNWANAYQLAHPVASDTELTCDFHGKIFNSAANRYQYRVTIRNNGPLTTVVLVDW
jgi:hypothetical protein